MCLRISRRLIGQPWTAGSQSRHLRRTGVRDVRRGLLAGMDAERSEEARQANKLRTGFAEAQEHVPVESELEGLVDFTASLVPDPSSPEERLLRDVVGPDEHLVGVRR